MTLRYLILQIENGKRQVELLEKFDFTKYINYRVSPIFPINQDEFKVPDFKSQCFIGFFFPENTFELIGILLNKLKKGYQRNLWFSHGLASIVAFVKDRKILYEIRENLGEGLCAYEFWKIQNNDIHVEKNWQGKPQVFDISQNNIKNYNVLDLEICALIDEFKHSLNTLLHRASIYFPKLIPSLNVLKETVNDIVIQLIFLNNPEGDIPSSLPKDILKSFRNNPIEVEKRILQRTDRLIQINSALSYFISQAFSGIVPIFENECQIRSYSFLGIGSAHRALIAFTQHVENVFNKYPIEKVIRTRYKTTMGVEVFKSIADFDHSKWEHEECQIDYYLENIEPEEIKSKLVYYSGRYGFRETEFSVSVPMQILSCGDSARWSLMTLSHELLHAHVSAIMASLFLDEKGRTPREAFDEYYKGFKEYGIDKKDGRTKLRDCIRYIIFNYCNWRFAHSNLIKEIEGKSKNKDGENSNKIDFDLKRLGKNKLYEWLRELYKEINEIVVHVLDYNYFYNCSNNSYLGLLWESWAPVPVVLDKIEHYIYRSILTVSSNETGNTIERFDRSVRILRRELERVLKFNPNNIIVQEALKSLDNQNTIKRLEILFPTGLYIVEMTKKFFLSSHIHSELIKDNRLDKRNSGFKYLLETGEFPGIRIESPIAFISDRLHKSLEDDIYDQKEILYNNAVWILITCASAFEKN